MEGTEDDAGRDDLQAAQRDGIDQIREATNTRFRCRMLLLICEFYVTFDVAFTVASSDFSTISPRDELKSNQHNSNVLDFYSLCHIY